MDIGPQSVFSHVEPVFPVRDIPSTIRYWKEVLGFPQHWIWGDPPFIGGVSWQKAFVQFCWNPALAEVSAGNAIWIRLHHVEALYAFHQGSGAEIVAPLELHAYGMAQHSVKEINGYYVHFAGNPVDRGDGGGEVVGWAFVLSDLAGFYYVKNVMVHAEWRGRGVGTALMKTLMKWVESGAKGPSLVGLFARESLGPFYQQFGFCHRLGW